MDEERYRHREHVIPAVLYRVKADGAKKNKPFTRSSSDRAQDPHNPTFQSLAYEPTTDPRPRPGSSPSWRKYHEAADGAKVCSHSYG